MKAGRFDLLLAKDVGEAVKALQTEDAKAASGFQSLGPMLNLRLAQPRLIVNLTRIPELSAVEETADMVVYGAAVTHAAIEDGRVPDAAGGALARVASGIAYRAVRNRGTIGGSLAHADPAADWPTALTALGAKVRVAGPRGVRRAPVAGFVRGAFAPALGEGEVIVAVEVPKASAAARFGYVKFCRKVGEFAEAMAAAFHDPDTGVTRLAVGATEAPPQLLEGDFADLDARLATLDLGADPVRQRLHRTAARRAMAEATTGIAA
ncbi:FAD binding domain-containing protein [Acuticoccus mangrovi]|uniref:FAD binding domain-containing protein n=1 Tax=Acuticoccus mangrovi TaxID=2796142 RepID=A0A934IQG8_9HYPH|nr:FAD binding domain-containing protein [Acuticoccus mangrovi]MBJ3776738.1 FAD binding domain-containing protein [Acuticoccus mangrovi]